MGILNIDEHVEEHRLMAIRYPSKAVIPGTNVIAASNIPVFIMPGDGSANGCQFTGTNGAFTLSAAILASTGTTLGGCYAYFSANFGGSSRPAGWYWTEFSSDTAGIVYSDRYVSGTPVRPAAKTAIAENLTGWITAPIAEINVRTDIVVPAGSLGLNGVMQSNFHISGSTTGTKAYRLRDTSSAQWVNVSLTTSPVVEYTIDTVCMGSHTVKKSYRTLGGTASTTIFSAPITSASTDASQTLTLSLTQTTNVSTPILESYRIVAFFGD